MSKASRAVKQVKESVAMREEAAPLDVPPGAPEPEAAVALHSHVVSVLYTSGTPPVTRARCESCGELELPSGEDIAASFDAALARSRGQSAVHVVG